MNLVNSQRYDFWHRFWQLALTNIISYIMVPLTALVSIAILGHKGNISILAGVASATVIFEYLYGILSFFRMGTTGVTAQAVGRDQQSEILLVGLRNGILAIAIGLLLVVLQYPLREISLTLLNLEPEVKLAASDYFNVRIWGFPAVLLNAIIVGSLLGKEQNHKVLLMYLLGNATNIVLNYVLQIFIENIPVCTQTM